MNNLKELYEANGYYIFEKLIPEPLIDKLLSLYETDILPSKAYFFRQSSNRWETNRISRYGYAEESFLNVHDYPNYPEFEEVAKQIFCSQAVREALAQLTGSPEHNLVQSMLFDLNTATHAHQDWYYLDSMPPGHLLAGWFALEDIHEEAGRFYVLPKSNWIDFDLTIDEKVSTTPYRKKLQEYLDTHQENIYAPALKKGDVLFWNSRTIHGSLETKNPQHSRKSLTAHYLPSQYQSGSRYATSPSKIDYAIYDGMKYRLIPTDQKNFSYKAKLKTDLWEYVIDRPRLAHIAKSLRDTFKKS
jgi:phytanoyl-CoA hydroxylase